jgi:hypothetical protein
MHDHLINAHLGVYHLTEVIGRGGMATVYKAHQPGLNRYVALKVLPRTHDPDFAMRFEREAQIVAQLQHPNILTVHDYGEQDGLLYLVLPYIENSASLSDLLNTAVMPARALRLMAGLLDALDYAHARGVIHRDIKPANVLLATPHWPMLADFGIAKLLDESQRFTQSGTFIGTAAYMAPEQATGRPIDGRTDLYALGVVLYELLTGRIPFYGDTPLAVMHQHVYEPPPPPRSLNTAIPASLEAALLRALAKDPRERYQNAAEMADKLDQVAVEIGRSRPISRIDNLYHEGVEAFTVGNWELAVQKLHRLVELEPANEDAIDLLENARERLEQARYVAPATLNVRQEPLTERLPDTAPPVSPRARLARPAAISGGAALLVLIVTFTLRANGQPPASPAQPTAASTSQVQINTASVVANVVGTIAPTAALIAVDRPTNTITPTINSTSTAVSTLSPIQATPTQTVPPPDALVNADTLTLRSGPGQQFAGLRSYERNTALILIGRNPDGTWLRVKGPDERIGWMLREYLQVNIALDGLPVIAPPTRTPAPPTKRPTLAPLPTDTPAPTLEPPTNTPEPPTNTPNPTATPTNTRKPSNDDGGGDPDP